jgi:predicted O-methyltransferase YrrM
MQNPLVSIVNDAKAWLATADYPRNETVRRLRVSEFIEHDDVQLKNMHRSETDLCDLLAGLVVTRSCRSVLEIGTLFGFSTLHLAEALEGSGGKVSTIDMRVAKRKWGTGEYVENIHELALRLAKESGLQNRIEFVSGRSDVVMPKLVLKGEQFDLIFIDGSHSRFVVTLDVLNALNLLSDDGIVVFDDVSENVALRDYNHGGPNSILAPFIASGRFHMLPLSYNTLLMQPVR